MSALKVEVPRALAPVAQAIHDPDSGVRYIGLHGGRGSGKSHFLAEQVILRCLSGARVACLREFQASIKDSVKTLLADKIERLGLSSAFQILETEIRGPNGSSIIFRGLSDFTADRIKSLEGFDIAFVEEAQTISEFSLRLLLPTIRAPGSQLWFAWNPRHDDDAVEKLLRGQHVPSDALVIEVNWQDNPWFPAELKSLMERDFRDDPEMAAHVWQGDYERITEASYYARHLVEAEKQGRISNFAHDPSLPVYTSWDIGVDDYSVIWFWQVHNETTSPSVHVIDFYEASGLGADDILAEALPEYTRDPAARAAMLRRIGRTTPYKYQRHFLPHDVGVREWSSGAKTRVETLVELGMPRETIHRGAAQKPDDRINAVRQLLPIVHFANTTRVQVGLRHLRRYSRRLNKALGTYLGPKHDEHSHASDAFGEFAVNCGIQPKAAPEPAKPAPQNLHEMTYSQFEQIAFRPKKESMRI